MSLKTLDVLIGTVFLYLLVTFLASAVLETISRALNWRAKNLYDAIESMLAGSGLLNHNDVYNNPLVLALSRDAKNIPRADFLERMGWRAHGTSTPPAYIPAATFSAVVLESLINKAASSAAKPVELSPDGAIEVVRALVQNQANQSDALLSTLKTTLATQGSSIQAVRLAIEKWFNDTMDRASGWYKRRTQSVLLALGLMIAYGGNVDTIAVIRWLWQSDAARQTVLNAATGYVKDSTPPPAPGANATKSLTDMASQVAAADRKISDLQYPVGWGVKRGPEPWIPQYLLGGLITAIAVSLGSTFWFDALQNLIKIRSTGPKPGAR
jgi:hypothetical protein